MLRIAFVAVSLIGLGSGDGTCVRADDDPAVEAKYRAYLKRPSLYKRMQGRVLLAKTGTPKALSILTEDYLKPEKPEDHVRYLIASLATDQLATSKEMAPLFATWRSKAKTTIDAWLWYKALGAECALGSKAAYDVARDPIRPAIFRAAALQSMVTMTDDDRLVVIQDVLEKLPKDDPDRSVLLEACAAVARTWGGYLKNASVRELVAKIAKTLDDKTYSIDTRDIVARQLAGLFRTDVLGQDSAPWLRELDAAAAKADDAPPPEVQYAPGPFFGMRAIGRRIVYVIDVSDSMLEPLSPDEVKKLKPVTSGGDEAPADPRKPSKLPKPPAKDAEEPIPWQKIKNRLDAAREVLKRSLRAMKPDQFACVVLFGDDPRLLPATPFLMPVEPTMIAAAIAQLDRIVPTPTPSDKSRPYGKLSGQTNLHGGIRLAFRVSTTGLFGPSEYTDLSKKGCDGVFVLSDGVPSTDDFRKSDKRDDERTVKDRETMTPVDSTANIDFQGPYGEARFEGFSYITDDVKRLNLFRQAEIHCVALGEASDEILETIADIGGGRFRRVGEPAK